MTYSQYGQIQSTDFNGFVSTGTPNFNSIWATLYGQTPIATVTAGSIITYNPWDALINGIANAASHQGTTITSVTPPVGGDTIAYISALSTNLSDINTNKYNLATTGTDITDTGTRTTNWGYDVTVPTVSSTITVTFGSAQQAQYFFNLGGTVLLNCSRTGAPASPDDTKWTDLCTAIGTVGLPGFNTSQTVAGASYLGLTKFGGSGSPDIYVRDGFAQLSGTPTTLFRQLYGSGVYTSDNIVIDYSATATVITITITFTDGLGAGLGGTVTGNLAVTGIIRPPSSTGITPTWGTPTVVVTDPA